MQGQDGGVGQPGGKGQTPNVNQPQTSSTTQGSSGQGVYQGPQQVPGQQTTYPQQGGSVPPLPVAPTAGLPSPASDTSPPPPQVPERGRDKSKTIILILALLTLMVAGFAGFYLGVTYRFASRGAISPYVRLQGGVTVRSSSMVETSGRFVSAGTEGERVIYLGKSSTTASPSAVGGIGVMVPLAPGYLLRMELADHAIRMERVTGPDLLANPPTETFFDHVPSFTVSIDIVLEQRRGRRF